MERALKAGDRVIALRYDDMARGWSSVAALILTITQYYRGVLEGSKEKYAVVLTSQGIASILMDCDNLTPAENSGGEWDLLENHPFPTWLLNKLHEQALEIHEENPS